MDVGAGFGKRKTFLPEIQIQIKSPEIRSGRRQIIWIIFSVFESSLLSLVSPYPLFHYHFSFWSIWTSKDEILLNSAVSKNTLLTDCAWIWILELFCIEWLRKQGRRGIISVQIMGSGARLCALLGELGYQGHESLDPDSFEWPFQYDDARPILDWLCSSLRPSNVLSPSEVSQLRLHCPFFSFFLLF